MNSSAAAPTDQQTEKTVAGTTLARERRESGGAWPVRAPKVKQGKGARTESSR